MKRSPRRAAPRGLFIIVVACLCAMLLVPTAARAQTGFSVGATAYVGGGGASLNASPAWDAASVGFAPAGTTVYIMAAAVMDAEGSPWYMVGADASTGYVEGYLWGGVLAAGAGGDAAAAEAEPTVEPEWTPEPEWTAEPAWTAEPEWTPAPTATAATAAGAYGSESDWNSTSGENEPSPTATAEAWVNAADGASMTPVGGETEPSWTATTGENAAGAATTPIASGVIVNTGGEAVRCRAAQSIEAEVLGLLREGQSVELLANLGGEWTAVLCDGRSGFVYGEYVALRGDAAADETAADAANVEPTESATAEAAADNLGADTATGGVSDGGNEVDVDVKADVPSVPEPAEVPEVTAEPTVDEENAEGAATSGNDNGAYADVTTEGATVDGGSASGDGGAAGEDAVDGGAAVEATADATKVPETNAESGGASQLEPEGGSGDTGAALAQEDEATAESADDPVGADEPVESDQPVSTTAPDAEDESTRDEVAESGADPETTAATGDARDAGAESAGGVSVSVRASGDVRSSAAGDNGAVVGDAEAETLAATNSANQGSTGGARAAGGDAESDAQTAGNGRDGQSGRDGADGADASDGVTAETNTADADAEMTAANDERSADEVACRAVSRVGDQLSVRTRNASVRVQSSSGARLRATICDGPNRAETADADAEAEAADAEAAAETADAGSAAGAEEIGNVADAAADVDGTPTAADESDLAATADEPAADEIEVGAAQHTGTVTVSGTNGQGLRCRDAADFNANVLTVVSEGTSLPVRGDQVGEWLPVVCGGMDGYIYASYGGEPTDDAESGAGATATAPTTDGGTGGPSTSGYATGDQVQVVNTGGGGVRFRSSPSFDAPVITVLGEGTVLSVVDGSTGGWVAVSNGGSSGYIYGDFLAPSRGGGTDNGSNSGGTPAPSDGGGSSGGDALGPGDHAVTTAYINFRYQPSFSGAIGGAANAGTVVLITGVSQDGFYPVEWAGQSGYMYGDYLSWTDAPLSGGGDDGGTPGGTPTPGGGTPSGGSPGGGTGSIDGISGGQSYPISQEYGPTEFAQSTDIYAYGTAYGLNGHEHPGLDIGMPSGTPLYSPVDGTVMIAGGTPYYTNYGNGSPGVGELLIQLDNGDQVILGHMSLISVSVGQRVSVGDPVGLSGGENGDHLHLEVRVLQADGSYIIVDPRSYGL